MQAMFRMVGFGENLGSGFPLILSAWNEKHWLKPELFEQTELMQVKLVLTIETKNVVKDVVVNVVEELTERQNVIYETIKQDVVDGVVVTASSLSKQLKVHPRTIQRDLAVLASKLLIRHVGSDKTGHWEPIMNEE